MAQNKKRQGRNPVFCKIPCVGFTSPNGANVSSPDLSLDGCLPATLNGEMTQCFELVQSFYRVFAKSERR